MQSYPQIQELDEGLSFFKSSIENENTIDIAQKIGEVLKIPRMPIVQTLTPRNSRVEEKSNYSGNFGMGEFPLHTDLAHWYIPPRYFLLRCISPSNKVATRFINASKLFGHEDPIKLKRSLFRPRRRLDKKLSLLRLHQDELYRWDTLFIQPMTNAANELQSRIKDRLANMFPLEVHLKDKGDCLLVDNWKLIHGRSAIPETETSRKIERIYLTNLKGE